MTTEDTTTYECANCDWKTTDETEMKNISNISQRVRNGEPMPAGECPECGALCHEKEPPACERTGNHRDDGRGTCIDCGGLSNKQRDEALAERATDPLGIMLAMLMDALVDTVSELEAELEADSAPEELEHLPAVIEKGNAAIEAYHRFKAAGTLPPVHLAVVIEGGMVQNIVSTHPDLFAGIDVMVIDYDDENTDAADLVDVPQEDGTISDAIVTDHGVQRATIDLVTTAANLSSKGDAT